MFARGATQCSERDTHRCLRSQTDEGCHRADDVIVRSWQDRNLTPLLSVLPKSWASACWGGNDDERYSWRGSARDGDKLNSTSSSFPLINNLSSFTVVGGEEIACGFCRADAENGRAAVLHPGQPAPKIGEPRRDSKINPRCNEWGKLSGGGARETWRVLNRMHRGSAMASERRQLPSCKNFHIRSGSRDMIARCFALLPGLVLLIRVGGGGVVDDPAGGPLGSWSPRT